MAAQVLERAEGSGDELRRGQRSAARYALAYYTVSSIAPLILITIAGAIFREEAARGEVFARIRGLIGHTGAAVVNEMVKDASRAYTGAIAATLGIYYSAQIVFLGAGLTRAYSRNVSADDTASPVFDAANIPTLCSADMTLQRMDNVLIVVEDIDAAKAFFAELGMEFEGQTTVEGPWAGRVVGLDDVRADIVMMKTPDGHGRVELTQFHTPPAVRAEPERAPSNTLGIRRIMFAVDDVDDVVARLRGHGAELVGEIAQYEDQYRLCFVRNPEGFIIGLAQQLT